MKRKQEDFHRASDNEALDQLQELRGVAINLQLATSPKTDKFNPHASPANYPLFDRVRMQNQINAHQAQRFGQELNTQFSNPAIHDHFQKQQLYEYIQAHGGGLIPTANQKEALSQRNALNFATVGEVVNQLQRKEISFTQYVSQTLATSVDDETSKSLNEKSKSRSSANRQARSLQPKNATSANTTNQSSDIAGPGNSVQVIQELFKKENRSNVHSSTPRRKKRPGNTLVDILQPNEIQALRVVNPLHQAFNNHLQKVVQSVQQRKKGGPVFNQDSLNFQNLDESQFTQPVVNKSEADAQSTNRFSISFGDGNARKSELVPYLVQTPARVRQQARQELEALNDSEKGGRPVAMIKPQINEKFVKQPRVVDQVASLLSRVKKDRTKVFIPLEPEENHGENGLVYKDAKNQDEAVSGGIVFSQGGFICLAKNKKQTSEFVSKETYIQEGVETMVLNQVPFFRKFLALKTFKLWKSTMQRNVFERNRQKLADNFIFSRPIFADHFADLTLNQNKVRFLEFIENKPGMVYGKHQQHMFSDSCKVVQQKTKSQLEQLCAKIRSSLERIRSEIVHDDEEFETACKESVVQRMLKERAGHENLILFSQAKAQQEAENQQRQLMRQRHAKYNSLLQLVSRILFQNISEALIDGKVKFTSLFCAQKSKTQYEISVCLDSEGKLDLYPKPEEHRKIFSQVFGMMEAAILKNFFLMAYFQDLTQLFFWQDKSSNPPGAMQMRRRVLDIEELINSSVVYNLHDQLIDQQLTNDLKKLELQLLNYQQIEEIYDFVHDWNEKRVKIGQQAGSGTGDISQEIEFYKITWAKLHNLNQIIETIPSTFTKIGTIAMETATIKKMLSEMPKQIVEQIRLNVTSTIENETRALKDELCTTSDTLDKLPLTLNIYVDQVNTLKYLKQKKVDFQNKFSTINTLQQQCKIDGIKISLNLQMNIEEVSSLYENLPKLIEKAEQGLQTNKSAIEQNMFKSAQSLSLKIKAFEKKYVENYLQDKNRLDHCKDTLEELLRRQAAIHDIKAKVILYKEFLRILYEDDIDAKEKLESRKLSCVEDCETIEMIHKNTLKMWKVFLYWAKKRHLCFSAPFLDLDLGKIAKAISKVNKFLTGQSKECETVAYKSQPITRVISIQVKETSVIVDFAKDLHKETLQRRHWIQIFNLLKAHHLKNSTTFTIIDLREYSIQNHAEEVKAIIDHANTEAKYENVFNQISREWEDSNLKIIPFKELMNDYVLANGELMADAIEENIQTLETIQKSPYASHVSQDLTELITKLKQMLEHLLLWSQCQKYWMTLDPIYNSGLFKNFFDQHTADFLDSRSQFRRIMWSCNRHPKTTFNLMIKDRQVVFQKLIHYYAMLQKQVNQFLEMKRLVFTRFYFLTDSQFLDLVMLANSHQDFSVYISLLFQGVQKLYVSRLLQSEAEEGQLSIAMQFEHDQMRNAEDDVLQDFELQLEQFIQNGRNGDSRSRSSAATPIIQEASEEDFSDSYYSESTKPRQIKNEGTPSKFNFKDLDNVLAKPLKIEKKAKKADLEMVGDSPSEKSVSDNFSQKESVSSRRNSGSDSKSSEAGLKLHDGTDNLDDFQFVHEISKTIRKQGNSPVKNKQVYQPQTHDFVVLGLISSNKELFLFDRHVSMSRPIDHWLKETEQAMQISLQKQFVSSLNRFTEEPLEEWILDYPQQIAISAIHLILSQEITEILSSSESETSANLNTQQSANKTPDPVEGTVVVFAPEAPSGQNLKQFEEIAMKVGGGGGQQIQSEQLKTDEQQYAQGRRVKMDPKDVKSTVNVVVKKRPTNEPELDIDEQQLLFLDDCFGEQANVENQLEEAIQIMKKDETRMMMAMIAKKNQMIIRRPDYKETVLNVIQHKGLHSLFLRLQYWINKLMKLLYTPQQKLQEKRARVLELPDIQKMAVKSVILFLKHQQEHVESMIKLKIQKAFDFEWMSKMKLVWSDDNSAQASCGGWTQSLGYEYLGTSQRLLLTPLTDRYFVFIASAMRERQSAMVDCNLFDNNAEGVIRELSSLCFMPFKVVLCTPTANVSMLTQFLNGCATANTWLLFEHMDNLNFQTLQVVIKEVQLLHQQFIVSSFNQNILKQQTKSQTNFDFMQQRHESLGVFASSSYRLQQNQSKSATLFRDQVRSTFRCIALSKPNMEAALKNILFSENYVEYNSTCSLIQTYIEKLYELKQKELQKTSGSNLFEQDAVEISNFRQCLKLANLIKNQNFNAYYKKQLERYHTETEMKQRNEERREVFVVFDEDTGIWMTKRKRKAQYQSERHRFNLQNQMIQAQKYVFEVDALREATRIYFTQKFLGEFRQAAYQKLKKIPTSFQRQNTVNLKASEQLLSNVISQAFDSVIESRKNLQTQQEVQMKKLQREGAIEDDAFRGKSKEEAELVKAGRLANARVRRALTRKDSLLNYKPSEQEGETQENDQSSKRRRIRHMSSINLVDTTSRQLMEEKFNIELQNALQDVALELHIDLTEDQLYNCVGVVEFMKRFRGIAIVGPICSGKTQLLKLVTLALQQSFNTVLKTSYVNLNTFSQEELYGPTLAFDQGSLLSLDQPLQQKSVFQLILNNYAQEKMLLQKMERDRHILGIYMDQSSLSKDITDCFIEYLHNTNVRERDYLKEQEFLLNFNQNIASLQQSLVQNLAVRFPNGNVTVFPSDMYLFFECQSLKDASPSFITHVGILNTQAEDVTPENIFTQLLTQTQAKHSDRLFQHQVNFFHIQDCCRDFLHPFVASLDKLPQFNQYPLWNLKALATQFFSQLNSQLFKLYESCEKYKNVEDKMVYPIVEMEKDVLRNAVLQAAVWSYGAVLNSELRKQFDDQLGVYKQNFNINFAVPSKTRYRIFEIFFDFDRLAWQPIVEKLEYKLKSYYEQNLQALLLPSLELSQAFYMLDNQISYMRFDKDLDKQFRLIGPSSSSKTVILNTFAGKVANSVKCISVPMSSYLTLDLFKETVEQNYRYKRQNKLIPKDRDSQVLLVIDDVHMHRNLHVDLLEFLRSWCFCRGYFSVKQGFFKKVGEFGCIMAENTNFVATNHKSERFLFYSTTLFCDEIKMENFKHYVQNWLTTGQWPVSTLISKYYLLISNSILTLLEKMKKAENLFDNFTFTSLTSFHFLVKFCQNLVSNTSLVDKKQDVFGLGYESQRREEEAVADLFCYEVMRTYGDRVMRPATRVMLLEKLAVIVQKEFLCPEAYNAAYIEQIVLGDYHAKELSSHHKYMSITQSTKSEVVAEIRKKSRKFSGNQFLPILLDAPTGLADLFKVCRILYKAQQHLILIGQTGVSKMETVQLAAILNQAALFEIDVPIFGQPLEFAYKFRQVLLSVAKFSANCYIVLNDQVMRDPVYYDFVFTFITQLSRTESFVIFDRQFFIDLCAIEAQHIKKLAKVTVPPEDILFRQAVRRLQKNAHLVFVMGDLMSYKETITMYPQLEYMCEVAYFEDLTQQDYLDTAVSYLAHSNLPDEIIGDDQQLAKSFVEVRNRVKQLMLKSYYSQSMLRYTVREENLVHGASEFIFNDMDKLTNKIYSASQGFYVASDDLQQVLLNIPLDVSVMNKHKYGVLLEVFRHLYELISMHLSIRKSYYETFLAKSRQFTKYFASVKDSKKRLYEDQSNHSFRVSMAMDKIKEIKAQINEKNTSILKKTQEIDELKEELTIAEQEVEVIINEKTAKLERIVEEIEQVDQAECLSLMSQINQLSDVDLQLLKCLQVFIQMQAEPKFNKTEAVSQFLQKQELIDILNDRRARTYSKAIFDKLTEFIHARTHLEYSHSNLLASVYTYLLELYRKLNIKNTMASTFMRIREMRTQIDSCNFSINYAKQSIEVKNDDLRIQNIKLSELQQAGQKLSKKVEEAEISHMRTDQIYDNIQDYSRRIQSKLTCITSRSVSLLGDAILLATSVVYLGSFSPEERESIRAQIYEYLTKVRNIACNKMWIDMPSQTLSANPNKSIFLRVLKDLGLRDILTKQNLPGVLSNHQFSEAIFSILFAPSCPVVCDPTGVIQKFVQEKLLVNMDYQQISGADLQANEKLGQCLSSGRPSIVVDVNNQASSRAGLTDCHQLLSRLAASLYNGVDFDGKRIAQVKKIKTIGSFVSHSTGLNRRIPILSAALEHISLFQAQVFQNTFEFQLNQDYLQNCTLVCAAPSLIVEARNKLDDNNGVIQLKEMLLTHLLPQSYAFSETKQKIENLNRRILQLEKNYENAFLIASGETLKNFQEYSVLRTSVEDIINAREEKSSLIFKYKLALKQVKLVNEASDVLFQMYLALKLTGKVMQENTYSWETYIAVIDGILSKLIWGLKLEAYTRNKPHSAHNHDISDEIDFGEVEVEIDNTFFKKRLIPQIHKTTMSSLHEDSVSIFNLLLSLRLAQTYKAISASEHQFILKQLVELKDFKRWRSSDHEFIKINEVVDKMRHVSLRRELLRIYPEVARQVFDQVEKHLGQSFHYIDASIFIQKDLKEKYRLSQVELLTFGFMCPDKEFKSKLALFMYSQNLATFDFSEEPETLCDFLNCSDWSTPIALLSNHNLNPVNLITSLAQQQGRSLLVLRADLQFQAAKLQGQLFNQKISDKINNQLADFSRVKLAQSSLVNQVETEEQSNLLIEEKEPLAKHNWLAVKAKEIRLDEGKIFYADGEELKANTHVNQIVNAANTGSWVLVCPLSFPQYRQKLFEKLDHMRSAGQINKNFRLLIDLQNFSRNEIPDSFLQRECVKFNLTAETYDKTIGLNDIWSKILDPQYLNILTDTENGNTVLKKIEAASDELDQPTVQFMQVFAKEQSDQHTLLLFNKFIESSAKEYEAKLEAQRAEMLQLMIEEKYRLQAEKEKQQTFAKQRSESLSNDAATSVNHMKDNIVLENQVSSALSLPRTNSTQQMHELAGFIAGINESSQPRLTVVASEGILNFDERRSLSNNNLDQEDLNSNFKKRDQSVPIPGMDVIPEASNLQGETEFEAK